ncbi:MAG TPA: hypothetical protein VK176_14285 [Phycisphaerales bacterium]|nr:hypothetical protein [Phycisphaerales bacterium]
MRWGYRGDDAWLPLVAGGVAALIAFLLTGVVAGWGVAAGGWTVLLGLFVILLANGWGLPLRRSECSRCRYDLSGLRRDVWPAICPECGMQFASAHELGKGPRQPALGALGVLLIIAGVTLMTHFARTNTFDIMRWHPTCLLVRNAGHSDRAFAELIRRASMPGFSLSEPQCAALGNLVHARLKTRTPAEGRAFMLRESPLYEHLPPADRLRIMGFAMRDVGPDFSRMMFPRVFGKDAVHARELLRSWANSQDEDERMAASMWQIVDQSRR